MTIISFARRMNARTRQALRLLGTPSLLLACAFVTELTFASADESADAEAMAAQHEQSVRANISNRAYAHPYGYAPIRRFDRNCIGMNDDFSFSWDGGSLVADAFKGSKGPLLNNFTSFSALDADRWPVGSQTINFVLGEGDHEMEKLNPWVLLPYAQNGSWAAEPDFSTWDLEGANHVRIVRYEGVVGHEFNLTTKHINLKVQPNALPANPRNRWHLVPKSMAAAYAKAMRENNFRYIFNNDRFTRDLTFPLLHVKARRQLADFCRIRFMLGNGTNSLEFTGREQHRTKPSFPSFRSPRGDGIPYEWKVWIANHLGKNIWHTDHIKTWEGWRAGDRYLARQASYFARFLRGSVIREYGNEIWNFAGPFWPQTSWVRDRAPYAGLGGDEWKRLHYRYGKRTWDTGGVWDRAFSARRDDLDLTIGVQTSCPDCAVYRLQTPGGRSLGDRIDSVSGTFYLGGSLTPGSGDWNSIANQGFPAVVSAHQRSFAAVRTQLNKIIRSTEDHVSRWHLYEGGSHMTMPTYDASNSQHRRVYRALEQYWNSVAFANLLMSFRNWWKRYDGTGELIWFNLYGGDTPAMPFGYYKGSGSNASRYRGPRIFMRRANQ